MIDEYCMCPSKCIETCQKSWLKFRKQVSQWASSQCLHNETILQCLKIETIYNHARQ